MAKSTFHSTKIEKKNLLDKLKSAPSHADVEMAIRVVEDAKLIHEMHVLLNEIHNELVDISEMLNNSYIYDVGDSVKKVSSTSLMCRYKIASFYELLEKRKAKLR